jgi:hypothetical protein
MRRWLGRFRSALASALNFHVLLGRDQDVIGIIELELVHHNLALRLLQRVAFEFAALDLAEVPHDYVHSNARDDGLLTATCASSVESSVCEDFLVQMVALDVQRLQCQSQGRHLILRHSAVECYLSFRGPLRRYEK